MQPYNLEIVTLNEKYKGRKLHKYSVDGIQTIGAVESEPFEIKFSNNTWQKVQVVLSLDGVNILSGEPATTEVTKDMWVVNAMSTLSLKAFPENDFGGAGFVFTSADKSVALHTTGNLSNRGIIAAAVFVEGHVYVPVKRLENIFFNRRSEFKSWNLGDDSVKGSRTNDLSSDSHYNEIGETYGSNATDSLSLSDAPVAVAGGMTYSSNSINYLDVDKSRSVEQKSSANLEKLVAIGAGQHVEQKITYVQGLIQPRLAEVVRVRYLWWSELKAKLKALPNSESHPTGFTDKKHIDLKNTPRIVPNARRSFKRTVSQEQELSRF